MNAACIKFCTTERPQWVSTNGKYVPQRHRHKSFCRVDVRPTSRLGFTGRPWSHPMSTFREEEKMKTKVSQQRLIINRMFVKGRVCNMMSVVVVDDNKKCFEYSYFRLVKVCGFAILTPGVAAAGQLFGGAKDIFTQISPNLPEKRSCDKLLIYKFSVAVGTVYFSLPCYHTQFTSKMALIFYMNSTIKKCIIKYVNNADTYKATVLKTQLSSKHVTYVVPVKLNSSSNHPA